MSDLHDWWDNITFDMQLSLLINGYVEQYFANIDKKIGLGFNFAPTDSINIRKYRVIAWHSSLKLYPIVIENGKKMVADFLNSNIMKKLHVEVTEQDEKMYGTRNNEIKKHVFLITIDLDKSTKAEKQAVYAYFGLLGFDKFIH